jgi:hypothetical protein
VRPKAPSLTTSPGQVYPGCETTLWQIGQWRCDYWRPEGEWCGSLLRLFLGARMVRTVEFGLHAREQAEAWRVAVRRDPNHDPR